MDRYFNTSFAYLFNYLGVSILLSLRILKAEGQSMEGSSLDINNKLPLLPTPDNHQFSRNQSHQSPAPHTNELKTNNFPGEKSVKSPGCQESLKTFFEDVHCEETEEFNDYIENKVDVDKLPYNQWQCYLLKNIISDVCKTDFSLHPSHFTSNFSCDKLVSSSLVHDPSKIIIQFINKSREHENVCKQMCFKNVIQEPFSFCSFIIGFYTNSTSTETQKKILDRDPGSPLEDKSRQDLLQENSAGGSVGPADSPDTHKTENEGPIDNGDSLGNGFGTNGAIEPQFHPIPDEVTKKKNSVKQNNEVLPSENISNFHHVSSKMIENEESHFFTYFVLASGICVVFYFMMYNKKKILALLIEGRKRNVKRRPNSAAYSKLDCNLEEAMASGPSSSNSNTLLY